jgi:hypothetical protein
MGWIRRSDRKDRLLDAVLLPAARAVFGEGSAILPLWGGAFFHAVSRRSGIPEYHLSDRAARLGLWAGPEGVEAELDSKVMDGSGRTAMEALDGLADDGDVLWLGRSEWRGGRDGEVSTAAPTAGHPPRLPERRARDGG